MLAFLAYLGKVKKENNPYLFAARFRVEKTLIIAFMQDYDSELEGRLKSSQYTTIRDTMVLLTPDGLLKLN